MSKSSRELKGALIGTLLGDSWVSNRFEFGCQQISKELIDKKAELLSTISPEIKVYTHTRLPRTSTKLDGSKIIGKESFVVQTNKHMYFKKLHTLLYRTGTKQVTKQIMQKLTLEGVALWFMDDGYLDYKKSSRTRNLRICTDSFDTQSHTAMVTYFNDVWGIQAKIFYHTARKGADKKPRLSFNAHNSQKLISLIYKHILPSFMYKVNLHYKEDTLKSKRCSDEYRKANDYILQHITKKI